MTDADRPIEIAKSLNSEECLDRDLLNTYAGDLISVVVPVRNGESVIARTLQSVLNQSHRNIEVFVVDDGSTDSTLAIVKELAAHDSRVCFCSGPQAGVAAARNCGIGQARGEFIAPLDADDLWHKDKLLLQLNALRNAGKQTGVAYCWSVTIDGMDNITTDKLRDNVHLEGNVLPAMLERNFLGNASTPLIRRACLDLVGGYDTSLYLQGTQGAEDWKLYLALAEICEYALVRRCMVGYRKSQNSMSSNFIAMQRSMELVRQWARRRWPLLADRHERQERFFTYWYLANRAFESNSLGYAALFFARSIQAKPSQLIRLSTANALYRALVRRLAASSKTKKPTTFWEFAEQIDSGLKVSDSHDVCT
ncbi:Glycosyl transferase family 2 [Rhodospirillales bacterium URHD0017]|nr:Glycosyl transferase family 2 [Rhodospirillales bacterium URHD0017]